MVDRLETERLRRRLGMDANPWRAFSRIVASYHYLRQPDVLEQFLSACRTPDDFPHLPWDLLIVDECHNLMPSPFGEDSELCRMLGVVAPRFEHRLFLSATPHNGHTRSFTGLLEVLDPVRFTRTNEMNDAMRRRVEDVVIRRLKRDVNAAGLRPEPGRAVGGPSRESSPEPRRARGSLSPGSSLHPGSARGNVPREPGPEPEESKELPLSPETNLAAPRFCTRHPPEALLLDTDPREARLSAAFDAFRDAVRALASGGTKPRRRAGTFAVEILGKRLLSCPTAFAESWSRTRQGFAEQGAGVGTGGATTAVTTERELAATERAVRRETGDDAEADATAFVPDMATDETSATPLPEAIAAMAAEVDLDAYALCDTLDTAMAVPTAGRPQLRQVAEEPGFYRVLRPDLPGWREVIDEAVRRPAPGGGRGPVPRLAFGTEPFIERIGPLSVFTPRADAVLMHLAHPMMQRALGVLTRRRYPGAGNEVSRWTVRAGEVPDGAEALILLSVEEIGVNALRETFHRWVRTLALPVRDGALGEPLAHVPALTLRGALEIHDPEERERAGDLLEGARPPACGDGCASTGTPSPSACAAGLRPTATPRAGARTNATGNARARSRR